MNHSNLEPTLTADGAVPAIPERPMKPVMQKTIKRPQHSEPRYNLIFGIVQYFYIILRLPNSLVTNIFAYLNSM